MRERLSLDQNWRFALGHAANASLDFEFAASRDLVKAGEARGAAGVKFDDSKWRSVNVPHDWAIELPYDSTGDKELCDQGFHAKGPSHPENSVGWYRRQFDIPAEGLGQRLSIEFDGVFRDSIVWLNGHRLGRHESGYTGFAYDITDIAHYGGTNTLAVRACVTDYEGWWYDGAGIYRHVWFVATDPVHVERDTTFVTSELDRKAAIVDVQTTLSNDSDTTRDITFGVQILDAAGKVVGKSDQPVQLPSWSKRDVKASIRVDKPTLWSCERPTLYTARIILADGESALDQQDTAFGIRTLRWDAATGFYLNDKPLKIKGTCNHQNHAGVGVAMPDALHAFRLRKLQEMGSNAYRCSHYAATPELLDLCDRMGILVMAENRLAGSTQAVLGDLEAMVKRDRNHPSIILWSLANEEHTVQWAIAGERIGKSMVRLIRKLDPTRKITAAMHDRGGLGEGFANIVDVHGCNYFNVGDINAFHERRPDQPIIGSEEGSTVCTRGIYSDDNSRAYVSAYDARAPKWGTTAEKAWQFCMERPWMAGQFIWTGFDYRGEPIPFKWPNIASHFGIMDSCGFPKDNFYYFQSWWNTKPVLHLLPHWNWPGREGQEIDVRCFSNCEQIELLQDGVSLGKREVPRNSHAAWKVIFRPGKLHAIGKTGGKVIAEQTIESTGPAKKIVLTADRSIARADGDDVAVITVSVIDAAGRAVPTADNLIDFDISGVGKLLGVGNGDPSSHESDQAPFRRLFSGLAMVIVQTQRQPGSIRIAARSAGLEEAAFVIQTESAPVRPALA